MRFFFFFNKCPKSPSPFSPVNKLQFLPLSLRFPPRPRRVCIQIWRCQMSQLFLDHHWYCIDLEKMGHCKPGVYIGECLGLGVRNQKVGLFFLMWGEISVAPQKYVAVRKTSLWARNTKVEDGAGKFSRRLRQDVAAMRRSPASSASHESFFPPSSSSKNGLDGATASSWGNRTSWRPRENKRRSNAGREQRSG